MKSYNATGNFVWLRVDVSNWTGGTIPRIEMNQGTKMAQKTINIGTGELTGDGESSSAFSKANDNFTELYPNTTNVETSSIHLNTAGATNNPDIKLGWK